MDEITAYAILNGSEPITDVSNRDVGDLEETKRIAQHLSREQPDSTISVVGRSTDQPMAGWQHTHAVYVNGEEQAADE